MEARETDKLFRDKLKAAPTAPKADSWEKLEAMLDEQDKAPLFTLWRVAAAVLLLIVSGWLVFFWNDQTEAPQKVAVVEVPSETIPDSNTIVPSEKIEVEQVKSAEPKEMKKKEVIKSSAVKHIKAPVKQDKIATPVEPIVPVEIEDQQMAQAETVTPDREKVEPKKKFKSIKITYKRGNTPLPKQEEMMAEQQVDTTGGNKIKEFWAQTKEISPGDMWADIREAKDNLFQRNSKKNNVKNLNK